MRQLEIALSVGAALSLLTTAAVADEVVVNTTPTMEQRANDFDKSDANKDGKLTKAEFATTPRAQPPADADETFAVSDLNKDGVVSKVEFLDPNFGTLPTPPTKP